MGRVQKRLEEGLGGTSSNRSSKAGGGYEEPGNDRETNWRRTDSASQLKALQEGRASFEGCVMGRYSRCPFQLTDPLATGCDPNAE